MSNLADKKPKKRVQSKKKGNSFENQIAKILSAALAPLNFKRIQHSGAVVGGQNFETIGKMFGASALIFVVGDVGPINEQEAGAVFKHSIETKSYKTPDNFPALVSGNANIFTWIEEAVDDAAKLKRAGLLIFKWNNSPSFCARYRDTIPTPTPSLVFFHKDKFLDIFYLSDLLRVPSFWYDTVPKEIKSGDDASSPTLLNQV